MSQNIKKKKKETGQKVMSFTFQWVSGTTWPIALISCCSRWTDADDSREGCVWFSPFSGDHTDGQGQSKGTKQKIKQLNPLGDRQ